MFTYNNTPSEPLNTQGRQNLSGIEKWNVKLKNKKKTLGDFGWWSTYWNCNSYSNCRKKVDEHNSIRITMEPSSSFSLALCCLDWSFVSGVWFHVKNAQTGPWKCSFDKLYFHERNRKHIIDSCSVQAFSMLSVEIALFGRSEKLSLVNIV